MKEKIIYILRKIRTKPIIYLGQKSLTLLYAFLCGYRVCLLEEGICDDDFFNTEFQEFVAKQYGIKSSHNWCSIIRFFSNSEADAFDLFFKLLDEYLNN